MSILTQQEAAAVGDQAFLVNAIPHITQAVNSQITSLVNKTLGDLTAGTLTPEKALYAWMEMKALSGIPRRLITKTKVGETAGRKLEDLTNKE